MPCLRYLCLLAHSGVKNILCCVFVLFFFVLCIANYSKLSTFDSPLVFSNVYVQSVVISMMYRAVRCVRAPKGSWVNFTAYQNFIELI